MYGCNGKCCDRVIDPETGEGQYFICGGIDTCDERGRHYGNGE